MPKQKASSFADDLAAIAPQEGSSFASDIDATAPKPVQGNHGAVTLSGAAKAFPKVAEAVEVFGTSPTAAKTFGAVARGATTLGAVGHGIATGNPTEVLAAPMEGWAAGKGGYFLGKGLQSVARPVAGAMEKAAPYVQALSTIAGAQGLGDLAQMAEPTRIDIGFLGVGKTPHVEGQQPALLNDLASKAKEGVEYLMTQGMSFGQALRAVLNARVKAGR